MERRIGSYLRPETLADALALRAQGAKVLAGATDFYPVRVGKPLHDRAATPILDITGIEGIGAIRQQRDHWRIGAGARWTDIIGADLPPLFAALQQAACEVGGRQIQNRATIGGNLVNASPAADGIPPLLALDAKVELQSLAGLRTLTLADFLLGPRRTALADGEILTAVIVPVPENGCEARSAFIKLGARASLLISIVMVAGTVEVSAGRISCARIAVGACSPVARRLTDLEMDLAGRRLNADLAGVPEMRHLAPLSPIDDIRADADYRRHAALILVQRLLLRVGTQAGSDA